MPHPYLPCCKVIIIGERSEHSVGRWMENSIATNARIWSFVGILLYVHPGEHMEDFMDSTYKKKNGLFGKLVLKIHQ